MASPKTPGARGARSGRTPKPRGEAPSARANVGTSFLGREREVSELSQLLGRERLITLTGAPGIGKSRLALELAGRLELEPASVRLVELAPVKRPVDVARALAAALKVDEVAAERLIDTLVRRIGKGRMLVVLDNCEHLLDACAKLVEALLAGCPDLRILATSREPIGVDGEVVWQVPPLSVPEPEEEEGSPQALISHGAVGLFVERAAAAQPGFSLNAYIAPAVAEICRRLDGIPLAIELAAARVQSLTPDEIARRLDDRFDLLATGDPQALERRKTLEAALDWSHELLSEPEQMLLRRLSVFSGGFDLEAVEDVCPGGKVEAGQASGLLGALVSKSLVLAEAEGGRSAARYRLLETIRAYAAERLEEAGETAATRQVHAHHYLDLAERAEPELTGDDQQQWLERLDVERANLRAAIEWSLSHGRQQWALRLAGSLVIFWYVRCHFSEGRDMLAAALSASDGEPLRLRAKALWGAPFMTMMAGDIDSAVPAAKEAVAAFSELGDPHGRARALLILGNCHLYSDPDEALALFEQSAALAKETGDSWCLAHARAIEGSVRLYRGGPAEARPLFEECVEVAGAAGDKHSLRMGLVGLGQLRCAAGEYRSAAEPLEQAVAIAQELGDDYTQGWALQYLGQVFAARGEYPRARKALDAGIELLRQVRPADLVLALVARARVARADGEHRLARQLLDEALTRARAATRSPTPALLGMAELAAEEGDTRSARRLFEEGLDLARAAGAVASVAVALHGLGQLARADGEPERAALLHKEALQLEGESGKPAGIVLSLEALAGLAAEAGNHRHGARLLGAAQALREASGYLCAPGTATLYEADAALIREALGAEDLAAAFAEGAALPLDQAVAQGIRGTADPGPSDQDWASLSDRQREVAMLVGEGLTNPEIAARLVVTRGTVKNHVRSIFSKLGIKGRRELQAEVLQRRRRRPPG